MEVALDVGQPDADDRVVEKGEEEDGAQGGQGDGLSRRAQPALLDLETRGVPRRTPGPARPRVSTVCPVAIGLRAARARVHASEFYVPKVRVGEPTTGCRRVR